MSRTDKSLKESPSKRLREVFYLLWEKDPEGYSNFEDYYEIKLEMLIKHYKQKLK